jgi:hypothetical protein
MTLQTLDSHPEGSESHPRFHCTTPSTGGMSASAFHTKRCTSALNASSQRCKLYSGFPSKFLRSRVGSNQSQFDAQFDPKEYHHPCNTSRKWNARGFTPSATAPHGKFSHVVRYKPECAQNTLAWIPWHLLHSKMCLARPLPAPSPSSAPFDLNNEERRHPPSPALVHRSYLYSTIEI